MWPFDKTPPAPEPKAIEPSLDPLDGLGLSGLNLLNARAESAIKKQLDPSNLYSGDEEGGHFGTEFNLAVTVGRMKSLYRKEPWVNATSNLIARTLSSVPFVVRDNTTGEILPDHPLQSLLNSGNKLNDANTVNWSGYVDLSLGGNYFRVLSDDYKSFWHVPVEFVEVVISEEYKAGNLNAPPVKEIRITGNYSQGQIGIAKSIPWEQVIHHKMPNPYNPFFGLSMYLAAARPILLDRYKNEFEQAFYLRGATHAGVIETDEDLTKKRLERLMGTFETTFTGRRNWWRTIFLPKSARWVSNGLTMSEMQHLEGLRENRLTLLAVLGIPASQVGIVQDVNRSTAEIQEKAFWNNTIIPMTQFISAGWNNSYVVKHVYRDLVSVEPDYSGNPAIEGSVLTKGEQTDAAKDALTINEIRTDIWGYPPLKDTDPRGNLFVSQVKTSGLFNDNSVDTEDLGPEGDEVENEEGLAEVDVPEDHGHSHKAEIDEEGNGETVSTSEGDEHSHTLTGVEQEDGSYLVSVGEGGEDDHTHPDFTYTGEKGIGRLAFVKAKAEASRDQERLERLQSEKYIREYRKYLALLIDQAVEALEKEKNVPLHLSTLRPERVLVYEELAIPVLYDTMDKAFVVGIANSRFFTPVVTKAPRFTPTDEQAIEVLKKDREEGKRRRLRERSIERFLGFDETATDAILLEIENGLAEGLTFAQIAKKIETTFGETYRDQAFTITRTETLSAVSEGLVFEQEILGEIFSETEKQWFHIGDVGSNPLAREWHLGFETEGKVAPAFKWTSPETGNKLGYPRDPAGGAKENINCFVAETEVSSHTVLNAFRREYRGRVVTVKTKCGREITGTPNHPMLTPKGWIGLGLLNEGDQLIKADVGESFFSPDVDIGNVPTKVGEYFSSLQDSGNIERASGSPMDFHGDGTDAEVEIILKDRLLGNRVYSDGSESIDNVSLEGSDLRQRSGFSLSGLNKSSGRVDATNGGVSGFDLLKPLALGSSRPLKKFGLAPSSPAKTESTPVSVKGNPSDSVSLREFVNANAFVNMEVVEISELIVRENFRGHVYNLSTDNSMYLASGFITHNCRCTMVTTVAEGATSRASEILEGDV